MLEKILSHYRNEGWKGLSIVTKNYIRDRLAPLYMTIVEFIKGPEKKIVFCNFAGKGYGGYPKFICDELIKRGTKAKLVWLASKTTVERGVFPPQIVVKDINSYAALWELSTAKIWIDNCRKSSWIRKSPKQFYLQTWHAGGPALKYIEEDAVKYLTDTYMKDAKHDTEMADLFISDCEWQNENYRRAFWYNGEILNCTTPPNDLFYQDWNNVKRNVVKYFSLDEGTHILLYAPTFRNNHQIDCYNIDYKKLEEACTQKFGGKWVIIVRFHPTFQGKIEEHLSCVTNGTNYPQIEDLLIASDVLITDFSATMFLAYRWKINTFLYASDYEDYINNERPLYFDIRQLPASFSTTNSELQNNIMAFSKTDYDRKCEDLSKEVGFFEGGHSVEIITNRIERELFE